jgi:hypothetical protein
MLADLKSDREYKIKVIPEVSAKIGDFEITGELKWIVSRGYATELGFHIVKSPKGKYFQRYIDYLAWRSETMAPDTT